VTKLTSSILCALLVAAPISAQRVATRVFIDFLAVGADGTPPGDLEASELTIKIGGHPRPVRRLRSLTQADWAIVAGPSSRRSLPFDSAESTTFARSVLILVDDESIPSGNEQGTKDAILQLLRLLTRADRVAFAPIPFGRLSSPSEDRSGVMSAVSTWIGRGSRQESSVDAACRSRRVLEGLSSAVRAAATREGPLVVVLFSASLFDAGNEIDSPNGGGAPLGCHVGSAEYRAAAETAARGRAFIYLVQPEVFNTAAWRTSPRAGLEHLAGVTGGRLIVHLDERSRDGLGRITRETASVFLADVDLDTGGRPQAVYTLGVATSRRALSLHSRVTFALAPQ
jgi:hypothetical protein